MTRYWFYFAGGDADDRFEVVDRCDNDSGLLEGNPAGGVMRGPGASVYCCTARTIRYGNRLWTVWEHYGDWMAYASLNESPRDSTAGGS